MTVEMEIPSCMPVMTLSETVFFPQAMLPLHIFEERYRKMLKDVLSNHRIFAVSSASPISEMLPGESERPCAIATAGIIRACRKNQDGTSNLVLQGLARVKLIETVSDFPYRFTNVEILPSITDKSHDALLRLKGRLLGYIGVKRRLGAPVPREVFSYLKGIEEPDVLVDLAAYSLCDDQELKQRLLETQETSRRLELMIEKISRDIEEIRLRKKLQGPLDDDEVWMN
jgi:Lon protease-like protein